MLLATLLSLSLAPQGALEPRLAAHLGTLDESARVPVIAIMAERPDTAALLAETDRLRRSRRAERVVQLLEPRARESQAGLAEVLAALEAEGLVESERMLWTVNARRVTASPAAIAKLAAAPGVGAVRWDPDPEPAEVQDAEPAPARPGPPAPAPLGEGCANAEPNICALQAPDLWDIGIEGQGVFILTVDDGVSNDHPDLANQIWTNPGEIPGNLVDDEGDGYVDDVWGWDFFADDDTPYGTQHGTHTAGIVMGNGTLNGGVRTGMAPEVTMAVARVISAGDALEGYQYGILLGVDAITSSYSYKWLTDPDYHLFRASSEVELAAGIVHVNSIGNQGESQIGHPIPYNISTPGNCPGPWVHPAQVDAGRGSVIAVGALTLDDQLDPGSSVGPSAWEDIALTDPTYPWPQDPKWWDYPYDGGASPGLLKPDLMGYAGVKTTWSSSLYKTDFGGTSAAAPHVGGAVCLLIDANEAIPPRQISQALQETAVDLGPPGKDTTYGAGKVQVYDAALRVVAAVTAYPTNPGPGEICELDFTGPAGSPFILLWSFFPGSVPTTGLDGIVIGLAPPIFVFGAGVHTGYDTPITLQIPTTADPQYVGLSAYLQIVTNDAGGPTGRWLASLVEKVTIE